MRFDRVVKSALTENERLCCTFGVLFQDTALKQDLLYRNGRMKPISVPGMIFEASSASVFPIELWVFTHYIDSIAGAFSFELCNFGFSESSWSQGKFRCSGSQSNRIGVSDSEQTKISFKMQKDVLRQFCSTPKVGFFLYSFLPNAMRKIENFRSRVFCGTFSKEGNIFLSACQGEVECVVRCFFVIRFEG